MSFVTAAGAEPTPAKNIPALNKAPKPTTRPTCFETAPNMATHSAFKRATANTMAATFAISLCKRLAKAETRRNVIRSRNPFAPILPTIWSEVANAVTVRVGSYVAAANRTKFVRKLVEEGRMTFAFVRAIALGFARTERRRKAAFTGP